MHGEASRGGRVRGDGSVTGTVYAPETRVGFAALERQHAQIDEELRAAFARVLGSSAFTLGEEVERFEAEFADYCDVAHCVGVASGTAALALMLEANGIGAGDEVIVPAHTFIASALAVTHVGATPVFSDVDAATGLIDADSARSLAGPRTAAVLAVHLYGQACDMAAIEAFARPQGLLVLEDAAQAHGARYSGRPAGSLGTAAAFSFYPSKNLGALGDGGAVCTSDPDVAERVRRLRNLGQRRKGEHTELGYNERLDGLQAALLRVKLPHLDGWNAGRRAHAARYRELLAADVQLLHERSCSPCIYHLYPIRVSDRAAVAGALDALGVDTGVHYAPAAHRHPAWAQYEIRVGATPNADAWAAEELSLPMHPDLQATEIERVADAVLSALSGW
jgi:dTDP-3-amino-3,4,6-trideoxy-alpha-D-glucose transaminase